VVGARRGKCAPEELRRARQLGSRASSASSNPPSPPVRRWPP